METSLYKELSYRVKGFRAVSVLVAAVTVVLCLVVGIGCWVLVVGVRENEQLLREVAGEKLEVEIVEGEIHEPLSLPNTQSSNNKVGRVIQHMAEIDFQDGGRPVQAAPVEQPPPVPQESIVYQAPSARHYNLAPMVPAGANGYGVPEEIDGVVGVRVQPPQMAEAPANFMNRMGVEESHDVNQLPVMHAQEDKATIFDHLYNLTQEMTSDIESVGLFESLAQRASQQYMRETLQWLGGYSDQLLADTHAHVRSKRSILVPMAITAIGYANYAAFGKFIYNEVNAIAEYNLQSRKLSGDPAAEFLDSSFWAAPAPAPVANDRSDNPEQQEPQVLTAATDDWTPQVNKVSIEFIGEILNTLLNMMREFLMKDHVMECLWYMFCEDLNHQAKYADIYGLLARVNSVGLKVLTEKETMRMDTMGEIWRSLTAWETLQCEGMFPRCDGPKALEIVNDVALGSRRK